ncbi:hypothetical protein L208DRAFT_901510 [Tricholoma matsutake]|nr:hypothetical protein L208DRAFT_901510 [Tricholoma matsutake 945]
MHPCSYLPFYLFFYFNGICFYFSGGGGKGVTMFLDDTCLLHSLDCILGDIHGLTYLLSYHHHNLPH